MAPFGLVTIVEVIQVLNNYDQIAQTFLDDYAGTNIDSIYNYEVLLDHLSRVEKDDITRERRIINRMRILNESCIDYRELQKRYAASKKYGFPSSSEFIIILRMRDVIEGVDPIGVMPSWVVDTLKAGFASVDPEELIPYWLDIARLIIHRTDQIIEMAD